VYVFSRLSNSSGKGEFNKRAKQERRVLICPDEDILRFKIASESLFSSPPMSKKILKLNLDQVTSRSGVKSLKFAISKSAPFFPFHSTCG
jgi:hypothetical protein